MKRSMTSMTIPELQLEHKKMVDLIQRLDSTCNLQIEELIVDQLQSAHALKFALECQIRNRVPAPALRDDNVLDFGQYKRRIEARNQVSYRTYPHR